MSLKQKIISGVFWQGLERIGSQGISFVIYVVLARLLLPKDFGVIALVMVFITLCNVVVDSGFSNALIQKKEATQADFCSVFFINIALGLFLYAAMFFTASYIASFYGSPELTLYLRFSSLTLVITSFSRVQQALLYKKMMFYLSFRINWISLVVSGVIGIALAYCGLGVWALIAQQLANASVQCLLLWGLVKWRPQWIFDRLRAKQLFQFGWKYLVSSLLDTLYNDIYTIAIGRIANLTALSYYKFGRNIPALGMGVINNAVGSVLFPAFSEMQNDRLKMKELAKRGLQNIMVLVIPALSLLFILAEPFVKIVFTDKWLPCVIYLRLCCIMFFFWPFHTTNLHLISACGRSDVFLILEIIKKSQALLVLILTYPYGVVAMVTGGAVLGGVDFFENAWFNRKLINYAPWSQLIDILPLLISAAAAGVATHFGLFFILSPWLKVIAGSGMFIILYLSILLLWRKFPPDMLGLIKNLKKRIVSE